MKTNFKKVKVLFFVPSFNGGGAEKVMSLLINKFNRELFEVINSIRHFSSMIENNTTNVEKYIEWRDKYEEQYEKLIDMGCVDIDI